MNELLNAVSMVGFPIVACIALYYRMGESDKSHREETQKLAEAINNNTVVMSQLVERLRGGKSGE